MKVIKSNIAGLAKIKSRAKNDWVHMALGVTSFAVTWLGGAGLLASMGLDNIKNNRAAKRQKQVLADYYRVPVAHQLGIDPNSVNVKDLELAAQVNPMIAGAIAKVNRERDSDNRSSLLANGGAMALGGILPGVSGVEAAIGKGAASAVGNVGGSLAGGAISSIFDKDVLQVADMVDFINEKRTKGEAVTPKDIMLLRVAQDETLQKDIKKQSGGKPFHKMDEAQQAAVIQAMPEMVAQASQDAAALNSGADEASVLMKVPGATAAAAPAPSWAARVGGAKAQAGSFVSQLNAERAAPGVLAPSL